MALAVTDSVYIALLSRTGLGTGQLSGSPLAGGWMIAGALIGLATLVPQRGSSRRPRDLAVLIQLFPYVPVLGAYLILFVKLPADNLQLLLGEAVLLALVTARQVIMVYENVNIAQHLEEKVAARTVELTAAREDALESSRLKSEFLATTSHEIRTPMNGVVGLTSLLLSTRLDDLQRQYTEGVRTAGELDDLGAAAHELKGAAGTIGAGRVAALCRELEVSGREDVPAVRDELLDELEVELADAAGQLTEFVAARS